MQYRAQVKDVSFQTHFIAMHCRNNVKIMDGSGSQESVAPLILIYGSGWPIWLQLASLLVKCNQHAVTPRQENTSAWPLITETVKFNFTQLFKKKSMIGLRAEECVTKSDVFDCMWLRRELKQAYI